MLPVGWIKVNLKCDDKPALVCVDHIQMVRTVNEDTVIWISGGEECCFIVKETIAEVMQRIRLARPVRT